MWDPQTRVFFIFGDESAGLDQETFTQFLLNLWRDLGGFSQSFLYGVFMGTLKWTT